MKKNWKIILISVLIMAFFPVLFLILILSGVFGHLQTREELLNFKNAESSVVLSDEGIVIGRFFAENRTNIDYEQLPQHLVNALISTEDNRFYEHEGVDSRSLARVLFKSILLNKSGSGGGSTITQQLVKNMFGRKGEGGFSLLINKTREAILALRMENTYSKKEILGLYFNTVSFGKNLFGIGTAASEYFNKNTVDLNIEESALLIGMLKATTRFNPALNPENSINRRNVVFRQMVKYNYLSASEADSLSGLPLILGKKNTISEGVADYFIVQVKKEVSDILEQVSEMSGKKWDPEKDGLIISTTLDHTLQGFARGSFSSHLGAMQQRLTDQYNTTDGKRKLNEITETVLKNYNLSDKADEIRPQLRFGWKGNHSVSASVRDSVKHALTLLHAGLLAIDSHTGAIRAWVGGIDFKTQPYDQILANRQLGSVFKPVLYALAFEEGMEPCQYLDNDSVILSGYEEWSPENFNHSYGGKYSLAGALVHSMNIPSFSLFLELGYDKLDSLWKKMGFSFALDKTPALALGTAEASIKEIAVAYSAFANGGYLVKPWSVNSIVSAGGDTIYKKPALVKQDRVLTERTCLLMGAILQRALREGTGASLRSSYGVISPLAGKTGTSQNYADAWFAAFNPVLTIVTRVGASSPAIHFNSQSYGTGSALALPLVALTFKKTEMNSETREKFTAPFPILPPGLEGALNCPDFKKDNFLDKLLDIFKKKEIVFEEEIDKADRNKKSFLERIFGR